MMGITVVDMIRYAGGNLIIGDPRMAVRTISIDTRKMRRGDFFLALKGKRYDGHDFLNQTLEKGASGLIINHIDPNLGKNPLSYSSFPSIIQVEDTYQALCSLARMYRKRFTLSVIGITGSNGKTTTKEMLATILSQENRCLSTKGNFNNHIGLPLTLLDLEPDHKYAVIEMGSSACGEIRFLSELAQPTLGVITSISPSHLKTYGSVENIVKTKMELLKSLPVDGEAFLNGDDPLLIMHKDTLPCRCTLFGFNESCAVRAAQINSGAQISFTLILGSAFYPVQLSFPGIYNVYNALAAAAVAWRLGIDPHYIVQGLTHCKLPSMRHEIITLGTHGRLINDAYNANPGSMRASLTAFVQANNTMKKIAVLGDMLELGDFAEQEHVELGKYLATLPLTMICIMGTYRQKVYEGALSAGLKPEIIRMYDSREILVHDLSKLVNSSTVILFKASRGVALEEVIQRLIQ